MIISDFRYEVDKTGKEYGWGIAEYSTPEKFLGREFSDNVYKHTPEESFERVVKHLKKILPDVGEEKVRRILKG